MCFLRRIADRLDPPAVETRAAYSSWEALQMGTAGVAYGEASGQLVTPASAEHAVSAVGACVDVIAGAISSLPAYVMRWEGARRVEAPSHPLQRLIDRGCNATQILGRLALLDDGAGAAARERGL